MLTSLGEVEVLEGEMRSRFDLLLPFLCFVCLIVGGRECDLVVSLLFSLSGLVGEME